jgi:hypothetical protein
MPACPNCGAQFTAQVDVCFICGTLLTPAVAAIGPERVCPSCGKRYASHHTDPFCVCGIELRPDVPAAATARGMSGLSVETVAAPSTLELVLYGPDRRPLRSFSLTKDVTLIGRLDAVEGCFPDIDVDAWVDSESARKVSRRHALVLHSRADSTYRLRPLGGNTGTQIEADMVPPLVDYPLAAGTRFILGGAVRFKLEYT